MLRGAFYAKLGLVLLVAVAAGLLYLRLSAAPLSVGRLPEQMAEALAARIGPGWNVTLRDTALELQDGFPALLASDLDIRAPSGDVVLHAPYALVSVDGLALLKGSLQPKAVEFRDVQVRVLVEADGSLTFSPAEGRGAPAPRESPQPQPAAAPPPPGEPGPSAVSRAVASLLDVVLGPGSIFNSLSQAKLTNARLVFVDAAYREQARFQRVDAEFAWADGGRRRFAATVAGPRGTWQLDGDATADPGGTGYRATLMADHAPLEDILLLGGLSALPATMDLKLSGRVDAALAGGRLTEFKALLDSDEGTIQIDDADTSPLRIERSAIDVQWDEAQGQLHLRGLELVGGETSVRLQGTLTAPRPGEPWRAVLNGKNATLPGAAAGDRPVIVDEIAAELSGPDGVAIRSLTLRGPSLSVAVNGLLGASADPRGLRLDVRATKTDLRSALRIWPEAVAPPVRRFLVSNLKAGLLDSIDLKVGLSGADIAKAVSGGPIPDSALKIDFSIAQGVLQAAEGLPPISRMDVTGTVTGTGVTLRAPSGIVEMKGGYALNAADGTFTLANYWDDKAVARIGFRLAGGADGVGALLLEPRIREIAGFEVDPAGMKGRADLKVGIGLAVNDIPSFADLPLTVNGTLNDLGIERMFGKDRLDGANLAVAYDRGSLSIKGEGKLGGSPASIDVQQANQRGEAVVSMVLDEAARSRRGLSFGPQLTGPLPVRIVAPLGKSARPGIAVEADLARAGIDQLIPGWSKPAGRPGKLSFVLIEKEGGEIQDLHLDSGSVQLRGTAVLTSDGSLDRADLGTFRLSPGDDMRAQIERAGAGFKVVVRGNVGDARPFLKGAGATPAPGRGGSAQREAKDLDIDLSLNILTGHNEEAITGAVLKASLRKDNLRHLELKGRLGATDVLGRTIPQAGGPPAIVLQADDAGALLRFADVYRRMAGGNLLVQLSTGDGPQQGLLLLRSFTLSNEPALRRIIPTQSQFVAGQDRAGNPQPVRVDINEVSFTKATVDFTRTAGRLDFKDGAIFGSQVGFTLGGFIDYSRDRMDISGTFVPAYGLNNVFAQVPVFGPLLGGNQYEGLFAVNFRVAGQVSAPALTVNPLSAVAPGFLRKLFGVGGEQRPGPVPLTPER